MAKNDGFIKGFMLGGLIGGFVGLLLAPKPGKELREELGEESDKILSKAKKEFELAKKAAAYSYEKGRDKFMEKIVDTPEDENQTIVEEKPVKTTPKKQTKSRKKTTAKKEVK